MVMSKTIQVVLWKTTSDVNLTESPTWPHSVMPRIRQCVECPKCGIRYVVSCSPYANGSYLLPTIEGCWDEYVFYCRCKAAASRWKSSEFKTCEVSAAALERGYGTAEEIMVMRPLQQEWSVGDSWAIRGRVQGQH